MGASIIMYLVVVEIRESDSKLAQTLFPSLTRAHANAHIYILPPWKSSSLVPIIGAVVGGVVLILAVVLLFFILRRRSRKRREGLLKARPVSIDVDERYSDRLSFAANSAYAPIPLPPPGSAPNSSIYNPHPSHSSGIPHAYFGHHHPADRGSTYSSSEAGPSGFPVGAGGKQRGKGGWTRAPSTADVPSSLRQSLAGGPTTLSLSTHPRGSEYDTSGALVSGYGYADFGAGGYGLGYGYNPNGGGSARGSSTALWPGGPPGMVAPSTNPSRSASLPPSVSGSASASASVLAQASAIVPPGHGYGNGGSGSGAGGKQLGPSMLRAVNVVQHEDAGPSTGELQTVELPPAYNHIRHDHDNDHDHDHNPAEAAQSVGANAPKR